MARLRLAPLRRAPPSRADSTFCKHSCRRNLQGAVARLRVAPRSRPPPLLASISPAFVASLFTLKIICIEEREKGGLVRSGIKPEASRCIEEEAAARGREREGGREREREFRFLWGLLQVLGSLGHARI
ncbi:Methyltransf_11 domain-containing protein [Psidium guajava]|nr:Methyltransf_11 domain-containing protein [Psidium guajava]